ncbi:MAG: DUF1707 SHOCT-like domain-containing protein, partial [Acidimicrobiales bacterium]
MADRGGTDLPSLRVSDAERDAAADALREHCAEGRLRVDEMSERVAAVFAARTRAELDGVMADLPDVTSPAAVPVAARRPGPRRRSTGWTVSVMGSSTRRGRWRPKPMTNVVTLMGSAELDLRQADVDGPEVVINAVSLMGSVDVIVPEGTDVELTGIPLMGSKDLRVRPGPGNPHGVARVHVRAFPIMGSVMVRSKRDKGREEASADELGPGGPG